MSKPEHLGYIPCGGCGKKAAWQYMPGTENYCDECVPRGCSCNYDLKPEFEYLTQPEHGNSPLWQDPDIFYEELDKDGKRLPCCEYWLIPEEAHLEWSVNQ